MVKTKACFPSIFFQKIERFGTPKPPVLLVHGTADPVVPIAAMHMAESELKRLAVPVTSHVSYGVGHTVDPVGLRLGKEFVAQALL